MAILLKNGGFMKNSVREILKSLYPSGYDEALSTICKKIDKGEKTAVFTPNSEMIYRSAKSKDLFNLLNSADILLPDGIGSYLGMKLLGNPAFERTTGIDLAERIIKKAESDGYAVFLLGAKDTVASKASKILRSKHEGLDICGYHHGYFDKSGQENKEVIKKINSSCADILFVCFGFPEQEKWIASNLSSLSTVKLAIGLGGSLDVWSGCTKRAPDLVSKIGLEWLWRVTKEPGRLKRVIFLVGFALLVLKEYLLKTQNFGKCYEIDNFSK